MVSAFGTLDLQWGLGKDGSLALRGQVKSVEVLSTDGKGNNVIKCVLADDRTLTAEVDQQAYGVLLSASQPVQQSSAGEKRKQAWIWVAAAVILLAIIGVAAIEDQSGETAVPAVSTDQEYAVSAYLESEGIVKDALKCPSTASFPNMLDAKVGQTDVYVSVDSYVDAENSLSAKVRTPYFCRFKKLKGKNGPVRLDRFVLGDKTLYDANDAP